jgi:hypothetical protein
VVRWEEEDALLGTVPDGWIAETLGIGYDAVWRRRRKLGIKRNRGSGSRCRRSTRQMVATFFGEGYPCNDTCAD